jgi:transcriptional regulator with XRE-family HTH domain
MSLTLPLERSPHPTSVSTNEGWKLLGALLKASRRRHCLTLRDVEERTGVKISTLSALETGKNSNPTVNVLQALAADGYLYNPQTQRGYTASELLGVACLDFQPVNPITEQPFTRQDFVKLRLCRKDSQVEVCQLVENAMQEQDNQVLAQVLQRWMAAEGLDWESFYSFVETAIASFNASEEVTAAGIVEVASGRLPTVAELDFVFLLPLRGKGSVLADLEGTPLEPTNDWLGTLKKLDLPLGRYMSQTDHLLHNGNGAY